MNRALGDEPAMAGAQIRRFLILPKELDADDGELTRTQKVRRGFIAERYAPLIEGLYGGATEASIAAEITYEDGRKGRLVGRSRIVDMSPSLGRREGARGMIEPYDDILLARRRRLAVVRRRARDRRRVVRHPATARSAPSSARTAPARRRCSTWSTASIIRKRAGSPIGAATRARMKPHEAAASW